MSEEKSKRRIQAPSVTTIISVSLVLFPLGLLGILFISAKKISDHLKENIGFHVYLNDHSKDEDVEKLQHFLDASNFVRASQYLSKDSAAAEYQKEVGEDFVRFIGYNPLPASFEVQLKADFANPDSIVWIKKQITGFSSVKEFDYQESLVNMINKNINRVALALLVFIALLLLIALALINNTIRLAIYSKRFLIKTMQLVGATGSFIRKPFLIGGIRNGILAGLIANILLWGVVYTAVKKIPDLEQVTDTVMMICLFGIVLVLGVFISGISTFFAVRKYLKVNSEELYY
ncbi:MAG: FtsX-like permease family protein [Bacteroidetes bacterium]|nr:MAG: FtsX-like permease family protein [Bacteroidota bacterium]